MFSLSHLHFAISIPVGFSLVLPFSNFYKLDTETSADENTHMHTKRMRSRKSQDREGDERKGKQLVF